jgi:tetratricopeptide (TPR) repeat protein
MAEAWWAIGELEIANYVVKSQLEKTGLEDLYTIIEYFRKSHELSPFHAAACGCLGYMLATVEQPDEARTVFSMAIEASPLSADLRLDYASFLLFEGRYEEATKNSDLALKLGSGSFDRASVWINRSIVALVEGNSAEALDAVNRAMFINKNVFHMPVAVALLYVVGEQEAAARLLDEMEKSFPGISPQNPVLHVILKPVDDILAMQRKRGEKNGPVSVNEIYKLLRNLD